ncbi:MAG: sulfatase-like hydrolase/transferase [Bacteroidetes bacterium]|nr:sulfatase-like hydrolase/transferase [Bacteroidota bacterium]
MRKITKQSSIFIITFLLLLLGSCKNTDRPNILLIYSDDQGSIDLNCYGAEDLHTPNLDLLANNGIRFTQFYAGSSVCSPSRAALLTGMSPQAAGLPGNTSSQPGHPGMPSERFTIAEMLKEAGYVTGHVGKWHLGYSDDTRPLAQGFDYSFGHMGGCIDNYSHFFYWNGPNRHDLWENGVEINREGQYFPDLMVEHAKKFFKDHKTEPFFLYFAINLPHYPLQPTEKWRAHYANLEMPRRDYAGFISVIDESVGKLVKSLESLGLRDQTLIIFQSDQGHSCETRAFKGGGNAGPYRGAKSSLFEGGIRVPAILNWPDQLPSGQVNDVACINYDWFPTIAEVCGIDNIPSTIEGHSLLPVISNQEAQHESFHWKLGKQWAVRKGKWKLLGNPNDPSGKFPINGEKDQLFLVNLDNDQSEQYNLAEQHPQIVHELIDLYMKWEYANKNDIPETMTSIQNIAAGANITISPAPNSKYSGEGPQTLINELRGSVNFNDKQWLGFEGTDVVCQIDLQNSIHVNSISIRILHDAGSWIFLPKSVQVAAGINIKTMENVGIIETPTDLFKQDFLFKEYILPVNQKTQYFNIKLNSLIQCPDWHPGKGGKAWLFIDEIIIQ